MADLTGTMGLPGTGAGVNSPPGLLGGIWDLIQGIQGTGNKQGAAAAGIADPLSALNSTTLPMLQKLLTDPSSIKGTPGYQFAVQQGQDAISTAANAQTGSSDPTRTGSLGPALAKFTEGYALQDYNQQISNLLQTLPSSPGAAASSLLSGNATNNANWAGGLTGIGSILSALGIPQSMWGSFQKMFGGGTDTTGMGTSGTSGGGADPNVTPISTPGWNDNIGLSGPSGDLPTPDLTGNMGLPDFGAISGGFPDLSLFGG